MGKVLETLHRSNAVGKKDCVGTTVEDLGDALEGFLACSVPNLKLEDRWIDAFLVHLEKERAEFYAHCNFVVFAKLISGDSVHEAGLAYTRIANNN